MKPRVLSVAMAAWLLGCGPPPCPPQPGPWYTQSYESPRFHEALHEDVLAGGRLSARTRYAELRVNGRLVGAAGWRCANASDAERCAQRYETAAKWPAVGPSLLVGRGADEFLLLTGEAQITRWLGPTDGLADASLRAVVAGYEVHADATGEPEGEHWVLLVFGQPPNRRPQVVRVDRGGRVQLVPNVHGD